MKVLSGGLTRRKITANATLWLFLLPAVVYYAVFHYGALGGLIIAFQDYNPFRGILASPFVGLTHFIEYFQSIYFLRLLRNTIVLNLYNMLFGFTLPIVFAVLMNEIRMTKVRSVMQAVSYLPHFLSVVVVCSLLKMVLSPTTGMVAHLQMGLGQMPSNFLKDPGWFRAIYVGSAVWQDLGWNSIVYFAALSNINPSLYEAASIDGANRWHKISRITLPSIAPTIVMMLMLQLGQIMNVGFEKVLLLYDPATYETADVISTYVYRSGLLNMQYSYATAVGLFNSLVTLVLIVACNTISKRLANTSLW